MRAFIVCCVLALTACEPVPPSLASQQLQSACSEGNADACAILFQAEEARRQEEESVDFDFYQPVDISPYMMQSQPYEAPRTTWCRPDGYGGMRCS